MTPTVTAADEVAHAAVLRLEHVLEHYAHSTPLSVWRWAVLQRMNAVRELLVSETEVPPDLLQARRSSALRERNTLLDRMTVLRFRVLADCDVDRANYELRRLMVDLRHHLQRLNDIAYDEVEGETGGSD
ncbi:hypothetical protein [Nocardioides sp. 616]|uniref:hypothetical protein n=1 Tax=Nocardioides sp. 616 TaxID=2268090 RepID=UPI000CE3D48F|nr:hypothetical protein [Nocardioides sp. 616]